MWRPQPRPSQLTFSDTKQPPPPPSAAFGELGAAHAAGVLHLTRYFARRWGPAGVTGFERAYGRVDAITDDTQMTLFTVEGLPPAEVYRGLAERGVNAPAGTFYAYECARVLGIADTGAVRAGIAPYTSKSDVDRLLEAVAAIRR